jgi:hypothetical protein
MIEVAVSNGSVEKAARELTASNTYRFGILVRLRLICELREFAFFNDIVLALLAFYLYE